MFPSKFKSITYKTCCLIGVRKNLYYTYVNEPAQAIEGRSPKCCTAEEAVKCIKSEDLVFVQGAAATPNMLLAAMTKHGKDNCLKNIKVVHMHTEGPALYCNKDCEGIFRCISLFMAANVRKAVAEGRADSLPIFLSDIPALFKREILKPNVSLIHVSPPDNHGFCSLGTSVDCVRAAVQASKFIIAQINENMPRTFGDSIIHQSHIDCAVPCNDPLPVHGGGKPSDVETKIGEFIANNLVDDGSTLQMGIGNIPDAVLARLGNHKNLGIHSEMFADGIVKLAKCGVITNTKKPFHKGRTVGSFLVGTKDLYDFVHNNPSVEMLRVNYVNSTKVIATNPKMTAINSAIEVDLTGQVVADSIGTRMYSGFGGQVDFIRGASEGLDRKGKPIIALPAITKRKESKIVPLIKPGAGVVTTRGHVDYVVTEFGIANLFGKTLLQRAFALIQIAHPDHREKLEKAAFDRFKAMPHK